MKAITLYQPWASAIMLGHKKIETRSWRTRYTGRIAIHAAKSMPAFAMEFAQTEKALGRIPGRLPLSSIVGFATLTGCQKTEEMLSGITAIERLYGDYSWGRWAWMFTDIEPLIVPIPAKGALGLWEWKGPGL